MLVLYATNSFTQISECEIIDSLNRDPVAYASISSGSFVIYSDEEGIFSTNDLPDDTLCVSRLGYRTMTILKSELTSTIVLSPTSYSIREIVVSGNAEVFELGYHEKNTVGFTKMNSKFKGVLIQKPDRSCKIESVLVHTRRNRKGTEFVIGLFSVNGEGLPGELIFSKEYKSPSGNNLLEISVEEANLEIPEDGVFVAIKHKATTGSGEDPIDHGLVRLTKLTGQNVSYFHAVNLWFETDVRKLDYRLTYKIGLELVPF